MLCRSNVLLAHALVFLVFVLVTAGCGSSGGRRTDVSPITGADGGTTAPPSTTPGSGCGMAGRTGVTQCLTDCPAGQWCDDTDGPRTCRPGCTADANCGANEFCQRAAGEAVGVCASCVGVSLGEPRASCVVPDRQGTTACLTTCGPGQYCVDDEGPRYCKPGCTSDGNCGGTDYCARSAGAAVGVCASCYATPTAPPMTPPAGLQRECEDACRASALCSTISPTVVGECVAACAIVGDPERRAIIACVEAGLIQPDPCAVRSCFGGSTPDGTAECEQACRDGGLFCATGEVGPTDVAQCVSWCGTATTSARSQLVECMDAAQLSVEPCAQWECLPR